MTELQWEQVPADLRGAVAFKFGAVLKAEPAARGITPGVVARLHLEDGQTVFFKGAPYNDRLASSLYEREIWLGSMMPASAPAPKMLWATTGSEWIGVVFQDIPDARHADLSPRSPDVPRVLSAVNTMSKALTAPPSAPLVLQNVYALQSKASEMLTRHADLLGDNLDLYREALAEFDPMFLLGTTLLHYDLHAANLLLTPDRVYAVDWSMACAGAEWIDLAMLAPRLIEVGHSPAEVEKLLAGMSSWACAPPVAVTGLGVIWTLYRLYKAHFGPEEHREDRAAAAQAGISWITYRLGR
ncbi:phosphotransferase [Microbispora amethystogenes]|uniref:phosphotransferase n=1 Tax=Microbispora amethystogenes TaxID=1427754 RepID=UPI0033EC3E4F